MLLLRLLDAMDDGEVIIRPAGKGASYLSLTWRVYRGIYQHVSIEEKDKENQFTLGRQLVIDNETYEDLDEIIARFVAPMAQNARDIISHKYFTDPPPSVQANETAPSVVTETDAGGTDVATRKQQTRRMPPMENFEYIEAQLRTAKKQNPSTIPYMFTPTARQVGKFMLSYMPGSRAVHEYVTVTPRGFRYRHRANGREFVSLAAMLQWFKAHYSEPVDNVQDPLEYEKLRLHRLSIARQQVTELINNIGDRSANPMDEMNGGGQSPAVGRLGDATPGQQQRRAVRRDGGGAHLQQYGGE